MTEQLETRTTPVSAIVGAVLVGLGFLLAIVWFIGPPATVVGLVLAHRARAQTPRGLWLATIIVGYIGLALSVFWGIITITSQ